MNRKPCIMGPAILLLLVSVLLLSCGCASPDRVEQGSPQAAATLDTGVIDLVRLAGETGTQTGRRREAHQRALEQAEQVVREYRFEGRWPLEGWEALKDCARFLPREGILQIEATGSDLQLAVSPDFDCGRVRRVLVRTRVDHGNRGHLFWITRDKPSYDKKRSIQFWLHPGDSFRTYTIEVGEHDQWDGRITGIRLDPIDKPGTVEIDSVVFMGGLTRLETDLLAARSGLPDAALELREDRRRVLAVTPGNPVRFDLRLPRKTGVLTDPELRFSIGLAAAGPDGRVAVPRAAHRFLVSTADGETIYDQVLDPATKRSHGSWNEARVSLGRYAGGSLGLIFSVEPLGGNGGQDCCAVFANPLIHTGGQGERPNVLIILVDTLRADHLGCYGHSRRTTPHIDRLRRESVLFRHAQSSSSWTAPAVASLFTGLHPYRHGVRYVDTLDLAGRFKTVAERFSEAGWFTGAVSDNMLIIPENGFDQGFRTFVSKPEAVDMRKAEAVTGIALTWLEHHGDRPFFLYLHYMDPHGNYQPRQPFHPGPPPPGSAIRPFVEQGRIGAVANRKQESRRFTLTTAEERRLAVLYDGEITANDFQVGRLLAWLEKQGLAGNTVVVFVADHGEEFADHGKYAHATSLFDELVQVPLLIRLPGPGRADGGGRGVETVVRTADLGPTLLDLAGVAGFDGEMDARPFSTLLEDGGPAGEAREAYFELNPYSRDPLASGWVEAARGLRHGDLKLIFEPRTQQYQLYDLAADPGEHRSIFNAGHRQSIEMAARLNRYLEEARLEDGPVPLLEDRQLQQLDALGYLDR